ncbi:hypothetical protein ABZW11_14550 [Nonomuraea sp. NPDC004580]
MPLVSIEITASSQVTQSMAARSLTLGSALTAAAESPITGKEG